MYVVISQVKNFFKGFDKFVLPLDSNFSSDKQSGCVLAVISTFQVDDPSPSLTLAKKLSDKFVGLVSVYYFLIDLNLIIGERRSILMPKTSKTNLINKIALKFELRKFRIPGKHRGALQGTHWEVVSCWSG